MSTPSGRTLRILAASAALVAVSSATLSSLASSALFTDSASSSPASVTSGSVSLALGGSAWTTLAVSAMAPGDARFGVVSVANTGSLQSRFSGRADWSAANALTSTIAVSTRSIASLGGACDASLPWGTGDVSADHVAASGETSVPLFGSPAPGAQAGDRVLGAETTEYYCVRLFLPASAGNAVAGQTASVALVFDAEQTANNA